MKKKQEGKKVVNSGTGKELTIKEWSDRFYGFDSDHQDVQRLHDAASFFLAVGNPPKTAVENALAFCIGSEDYNLSSVPK